MAFRNSFQNCKPDTCNSVMAVGQVKYNSISVLSKLNLQLTLSNANSLGGRKMFELKKVRITQDYKRFLLGDFQGDLKTFFELAKVRITRVRISQG